MPTDATFIVKRYHRYMERRRMWEEEWRDLARLVLPRKSNVLLGQTPGQRQTQGLYDGTGIKANQDLAATMQGTLSSNALRWFSLKMRNKVLNDIKEVGVWLDEVADRMYLAFQQSNFESEMYEVYLDLGAFGIGSLFLEEADIAKPGFNGLRFRHLTIGSYVIDEDAQGRVDTLMRKFALSARAAVQRFGDELSDRVKLWGEKEPERQVGFLHVVEPREGGNPEGPAKGLPWASVYCELGEASRGTDLGGGQSRVVQESGYHEFPFMVPRWSRSDDEIYGRGPGHVALPDLRSMNKAMQFTFEEWAMAIRPPQKALHGGIAGTIRQVPAAITWLYDMNALAPWDRGVQFQTNLVELDRLEKRIRAAYFSDLTELPPIQPTPMSATEIVKRFEIMERKLGPSIGRTKAELHTPTIDRTFGLLWRAGELPTPPAVLMEDRSVDVEYQGPLERAQRLSDLVAIERKNAWVLSVVELKPEILDNFDYDEEARHVADVTGLPARLSRGKVGVTKLREMRAKAQVAQEELIAAQQMAQIAAQGGRGIKNMAEAAAVNGQGANDTQGA